MSLEIKDFLGAFGAMARQVSSLSTRLHARRVDGRRTRDSPSRDAGAHPKQEPVLATRDRDGELAEALAAFEREDYAAAFEVFSRLAKEGHAEAQNKLAVMYDDGLGVDSDDRTAVAWYLRAAEQDHPKAQANLGVMYRLGTGVEKSFREAFRWTERAAEQGVARAQYNLGLLHFNGEGVRRSYTKAYMWFALAARQDNEGARDALESLNLSMSRSKIALAERMVRDWSADHRG